MLRAHLQLGLIGAAAEFRRRLPVNQASAEEPFVALLDVIGIGVRNWGFVEWSAWRLDLVQWNRRKNKSE